jgi:hypothetical protein
VAFGSQGIEEPPDPWVDGKVPLPDEQDVCHQMEYQVRLPLSANRRSTTPVR